MATDCFDGGIEPEVALTYQAPYIPLFELFHTFLKVIEKKNLLKFQLCLVDPLLLHHRCLPEQAPQPLRYLPEVGHLFLEVHQHQYLEVQPQSANRQPHPRPLEQPQQEVEACFLLNHQLSKPEVHQQ